MKLKDPIRLAFSLRALLLAVLIISVYGAGWLHGKRQYDDARRRLEFERSRIEPNNALLRQANDTLQDTLKETHERNKVYREFWEEAHRNLPRADEPSKESTQRPK